MVKRPLPKPAILGKWAKNFIDHSYWNMKVVDTYKDFIDAPTENLLHLKFDEMIYDQIARFFDTNGSKVCLGVSRMGGFHDIFEEGDCYILKLENYPDSLAYQIDLVLANTTKRRLYSTRPNMESPVYMWRTY